MWDLGLVVIAMMVGYDRGLLGQPPWLETHAPKINASWMVDKDPLKRKQAMRFFSQWQVRVSHFHGGGTICHHALLQMLLVSCIVCNSDDCHRCCMLIALPSWQAEYREH